MDRGLQPHYLDLFRRAALNLQSELAFTHLTTQPLEEAVHAVNRL